MDPIKRISAVDAVEAALLDGLCDGLWKGTMPGIRLLSKSLEVSPPTVQAALARLIETGVLSSQGERRRL